MKYIPFNNPYKAGSELGNIAQALNSNNLSGNGQYSVKCENLIQKKLKTEYVKLTTSATASLEIAAMLIDLKEGDEVIVPSFTFVSTVNAFVLRGAKPVFVDIKISDLNIDEHLIESAITSKTKAIFVVHYGGVSCNMAVIMKIAKKYKLKVVEDAAQGIGAKFGKDFLGTIGDIGVISFHATKNVNCGEGGAIILKDKSLYERTNIIIEKGTNRHKFINGQVDKYGWVDIGSSYILSELNAAYLYSQLNAMEEINSKRISLWKKYYELLSLNNLEKKINLCNVPKYSTSNGHIFYILLKKNSDRERFITYLKEAGIQATSHYTALHLSEYAKKMNYRSHGSMENTEYAANNIVRLPIWPEMENVEYIVGVIRDYFRK